MKVPRLAFDLLAVGGILAITSCAAPSSRTTEVAVGALGGPTTTSTPSETTTSQPTPATSQPPAPCIPPASFRPGPLPAAGDMPAGSSMREILERGHLIAGVDENTLLLSYRNPATGDLEGFEIDLIRELARAIFGSPDAVDFTTVTTAQKVDVVEQGVVDITASAVSINCSRWEQVSFSAPYFHAAQKVMVRENSPVHRVSDLDGRTVCVTQGSTSLGVITEVAPRAMATTVETRTDCLMELQDGDVDAIFTHDTFLLGFAQQDPHTRLLPDELSQQFYGVAIAHEREDLVRFVNGVLERMRADGTLWSLAERWTLDGLGRPIPDAEYRD